MDIALPQYSSSLDLTPKFSNFDTREVGKRQYLMLADFSYNDEVYGLITAPKDFVTNYASLDALRNIVLFPVYALLADYGDKSATIHDWLYSGGTIVVNGERVKPTREQADEIFYRALRSEGIARWRAGMFYYGVRAFAASHFEAA
jgi:Protein of unknown function (DUF1353).